MKEKKKYSKINGAIDLKKSNVKINQSMRKKNVNKQKKICMV